jgi:hypothetical protein
MLVLRFSDNGAPSEVEEYYFITNDEANKSKAHEVSDK